MVVFKIDFEKAYDHLGLNPFLDLVLERKGFNPRWRAWMRSCLSFVSFAVLVNGNAKGRSKLLENCDKEILYLHFSLPL